MYTFDDGGGRSLTLRPEGTAPVCRAYLEHGMHKLPQPVKLWYLSSFFRHEAPQAGRYRQFWQIGAEAIGSDDAEADAELIVLLAELLEALSGPGVRLRLASLGTPETRAAYREELTAYLRAHEDRLVRGRPRPDRPQPAARVRRDRPGHARGDGGAPMLLDRLDADDAEHFAEVRALLDDAGLAYELDPTLVRGLDYYTRTVFEFTSDALGAQSGVGGGGRYDGLIEQLGGPPTPGSGWAAGVERMLLAAAELPVAPELVDLFVATSNGDRARRPDRVRARARRAPRRACGAARARRPLAQGPAQARRPARRPLRCDRRRRRAREPEGHGVRRAARARAGRRDPGDPPREPAVMKHAPRPNGYRDAWCGAADRRARGDAAPASPAGSTAAATTAA